MNSLYEIFMQIEDKVKERVVRRLRSEMPLYAQLPEEEVWQRTHAALLPYARDLDEAKPRYFYEYWHNISDARARQGITLDTIMQVLLIGTQEMISAIQAYFEGDPKRQLAVIEKAYEVTSTGIASVYAAYDNVRQEVIETQRSELQELSTPIIPIYAGILVLPLVGSVDSHRAAEIMEALLEGINNYSADVVIIDITGVPIIDTGVANYLLQAARAARLLGSQVVLVGIGAEIAQTIVQLGIDLSGIITRANLQSGIEYALSLKGLQIT